MLRISRDQTTCLFGPDQQPVAEVAPGETLLFEAQDAQAGTVRTHADALSVVLPISQANPVTGPVYVLGAQPGDTLAVRIVDIRLGPRGLGRVRPGRGVLGDELRAPAANLIPIQDGLIHFNEHIQFPIRPMVGTIGTAPAGGSIHSYHPGPHGGNLDINAASIGATVYLPVAVPGALFSLGDVHASMGDGELTGGGIDITADVIVQLALHRDLGWRRPVIETAYVSEAPTPSHITLLHDLLFLLIYVMIAYLFSNCGLGYARGAKPPAHTLTYPGLLKGCMISSSTTLISAEVGCQPNRRQPRRLIGVLKVRTG